MPFRSNASRNGPFGLCQAESFGNSFLAYRSSTQSQPYLPCSRIAAETLRSTAETQNVPLFLSSGSKVRVMVMIVQRSCGQGVPSISYRYGITSTHQRRSNGSFRQTLRAGYAAHSR